MIKEREERLAKIKTLHDTIKEHPYWLTFDTKFIEEIRQHFLELSRYIYNSSDEANPYYVILRCITHDFNCMLSNIYYWVKDGKFDEHKGNVIMVLQSYLMNIHRLIDGNISEKTVVGYTYLGRKVNKFQAEYDKKESKYYAVAIIKSEDIPSVRRWCENRAKLTQPSHTKDFATRCLADIDKGKRLIGKCWRVID